jgi:hypothetical protein
MSTTALLGSQSNTEYGISLPARGHPVGDLALSPVEPGGASPRQEIGQAVVLGQRAERIQASGDLNQKWLGGAADRHFLRPALLSNSMRSNSTASTCAPAYRAGLVQLLTTSSSAATKPETASLIGRRACGLGFEGVVSKTRDTPYAPGKHGGPLAQDQMPQSLGVRCHRLDRPGRTTGLPRRRRTYLDGVIMSDQVSTTCVRGAA